MAPTDTFFAADRAAWRDWLAGHQGSATFVWLLIHKKHVAETVRRTAAGLKPGLPG